MAATNVAYAFLLTPNYLFLFRPTYPFLFQYRWLLQARLVSP
jgi:hypothetical protein